MRRIEAFVTLPWRDEKITSIHYTYYGFLITRYFFTHSIIFECKYILLLK